MRKSLIIAAGLMLGAAATPAFAVAPAGVDGTVTVNANVAPKCLFTTPSQTITIAELAGADGKLDASTVNGKNATLVGWCNGSAATMQVTAAPLDNAGSGGTSFDSRVNYTATALANSVSATDVTTDAGAAGTAQNVGLFSGNVVVTLSSAATPGGKLLLSGAYTGAVTVTLAPGA